ncbi:MAG: MinD/ParA family protein [Deltaproteobacteria bacterium]|nr:MinD/ParA family protein [Deltaproteobacteria bacterium]
MTRTVTIASGKGGVGKTNLAVNLAIALSRAGRKTCLFDADLGLANVDILLGLAPRCTLKDVVMNGASVREVMVRDVEGVDILPGCSGVEEMADLDPGGMDHLIRSLSELSEYGFLIFDTSAGISRHVTSFCLASSETVLVVTPEPTSLTDAYALLKTLSLKGFKGRVRVVINQCGSASLAEAAFKKLKSAASKYLAVAISPLGVIRKDPKVSQAVKSQKSVLSLYPDGLYSRAVRRIGDRLLDEAGEPLGRQDMTSFWRSWLGFISGDESIASVPAGKDAKSGHEVNQLSSGSVERLVEDVSSISRELRLIRRALEANGKGISLPVTPPSGLREWNPAPIQLDIEGFMRGRCLEEKDPSDGKQG